MNRKTMGILAAASLLAGAVGCASSSRGFQPIALTKDTSLVAGCEQLKPVSADAKSNDSEAFDELSHKTREQGGNYVLVSGEGAHTGVAYRCASPAQPSGTR